jgi:uncharacterized protein
MKKPKNFKLTRSDYDKAANIIRDAGGKVIGRTRLQKIAFLLELTGQGEGFSFSYHHYGPYSEELNLATQVGKLFEVLDEDERQASWGGKYSIFTTERKDDEVSTQSRKSLAKIASEADPIELELAATAAFLASEGIKGAWAETARRKPEKIRNGRLAKAKALYSRLQILELPKKLPNIS